MREQAYQLASVSGDGKVLFWTLANKLECPLQVRLACVWWCGLRGGDGAFAARSWGYRSDLITI
jgi:hypothetical protein